MPSDRSGAPRWTCPTLPAADGHHPILPTPRLHHWTCPPPDQVDEAASSRIRPTGSQKLAVRVTRGGSTGLLTSSTPRRAISQRRTPTSSTSAHLGRHGWACPPPRLRRTGHAPRVLLQGPGKTGHAPRPGPGLDIVPLCPVAASTNGHVPWSGYPRMGMSPGSGLPPDMSLNEKWPPPRGRPPSRCYFKLATAKPRGADSPGTVGN